MIRLKCFGPRPNLSSQSPRGVLSRLDGAAWASQSSNTAGGRRSGCAPRLLSPGFSAGTSRRLWHCWPQASPSNLIFPSSFSSASSFYFSPLFWSGSRKVLSTNFYFISICWINHAWCLKIVDEYLQSLFSGS